jgi:hypothetical protein
MAACLIEPEAAIEEASSKKKKQVALHIPKASSIVEIKTGRKFESYSSFAESITFILSI